MGPDTAEWTTPGQPRDKQHSAWSELAQQTAKKTTPTRMSSSWMTLKKLKKQREQRASQHHSSRQNRTEQERLEHELTHLSYRNWCSVCVQSKGRQNNHPKQATKQPVIQVDVTYYKSLGEKQTTRIPTAIDLETGTCMAAQIEDRKKQHGIPVNMFPAVSDGMSQNTCHPEQHRHTVRLGRLSDSTTQDNSSNIRRQPGGQTSTSIHLTSTRHRGRVPQNTDGTGESTQVTTREQLPNTPHKQASHHAMDGETRSIPPEQVRRTPRRQHQLL